MGHCQQQLGNRNQAGGKEEATEPGWRGKVVRTMPRFSGWSPQKQQWEGTLTWRVMMSCREKGSSVSRSRKFLALIFSCSTACPDDSTIPGVRKRKRKRKRKRERKRKMMGQPRTHDELTTMARSLRVELAEPQRIQFSPPGKAPRRTHS